MKKNLLITLGCSYTEGVGCYDYSKMSSMVKYMELDYEERRFQVRRFHEFGWPNRVGKKLGFDKVINIGLGGSSNIVQMNRFVGLIVPQIEKLKEEYDIFLIWLMTDPSRFSFATSQYFFTILPGSEHNLHLGRAYILDDINLKFNPIVDQAFLMKTAELVFKSQGINFIFTSWNTSFELLYGIFESPNYLKPEPHYLKQNYPETFFSKVCRHLNEEGYERLAQNICNLIDMYHPKFRVGNQKEKIEWEHLGHESYKQPASYPYFVNSL